VCAVSCDRYLLPKVRRFVTNLPSSGRHAPAH
jgi:hypothetical protein